VSLNENYTARDGAQAPSRGKPMEENSEIIAQRLLSVKVKGKTYTYRAVFERDEDGRIVVECPALEACYTEGRTLDEAIEMIKDALKLSIEARIKLHELIPEVEYRETKPRRMTLGDVQVSFAYSRL
jgi:predicted RNase H-like HicB family nuclease